MADAADATPAADNAATEPVPFSPAKETAIVSEVLAPTWNATPAPPWKSAVPVAENRLSVPKVVLEPMRVISVRRALNSSCAALRAAWLLEPLAACTARSRMRWSMVLTSFRAPSAVCTTEMASWALRVA